MLPDQFLNSKSRSRGMRRRRASGFLGEPCSRVAPDPSVAMAYIYPSGVSREGEPGRTRVDGSAANSGASVGGV
ncbi:hypothetical protein GCM10028820_03640 [Tessaracoccus terricola]